MPQRKSEVTEGLMHLNAFVQSVERQLPIIRRHICRLTVLAEREAGFKARDVDEYRPVRRHTRPR